MSQIAEIKRLYDEANAAHVQAKAILAEFAGKEMPKEKETEVDGLLDQVEAKSEQAKRLERADEAERFLAEPVNEKRFFTSEGTAMPKVEWAGKVLDADEIEELKAAARFLTFLRTNEAASQEYAKAFRRYLKTRANEGMPEWASKALSPGESTAGGYLVQDTFLNTLLVKSREVSAMRRLANVLPPVPAGAVIFPSEDSVFTDASWTTEVLTGSEDTVKPFGRRKLQPYPFAKSVKVSNTLLRIPTYDVEAYIRDRLAYKFGVTEEAAFVSGDGVGKPLGLWATPDLPSYETAAALTVSADDVLNWIYSLPAAYAAAARILCHRSFLRKVRTLKDGMGQYIWQPGLQTGSPNAIVDVPYEVSDRVDDALSAADAWEAGKAPAIIGDYSYYWIVDAMDLSIQRLNELYAATNQTGFIGRKECDGGCVLTEAFLALKIKS